MGPAWGQGAAVLAASLGLGGCLVVNGAFQPGGDDGESSSAQVSTGTSPGPSTDSDASSGAPTGGETASGEGSSAESSGGESSSGSSSTGPDLCGGAAEDLCVTQEIAGRSYLVCERLSSWEEARLACEARCAQLVILDELENAEIFAALRQQMTSEDIAQEQGGGDQTVMPRASWWIGGRKVEGAYLWLDGTPMPPKGTGGWSGNDPDIDGDDACATLGVFGKGDTNGKWFDRGCDTVPYRFVCERP